MLLDFANSPTSSRRCGIRIRMQLPEVASFGQNPKRLDMARRLGLCGTREKGFGGFRVWALDVQGIGLWRFKGLGLLG